MSGYAPADAHIDESLQRNTVWKLDVILLPFLSLLFLFNSLDKSNIGNAESAHFTSDIGLAKEDLNTAVALFFAFFVTLQPIGAALGRRYGMVLYVPTCMLLWGISTTLHVWVTRKWQLYTLRVVIACLEAGFYPVTVSYLSLFYTRFEFARRLALFYGQAAVGGALGGILAYLVFSRFPGETPSHDEGGDPITENTWKSWQVLFMIEGICTMVIAIVGYAWLPHGPRDAWFLSKQQRRWAEERIRLDRIAEHSHPTTSHSKTTEEEEGLIHQESQGLLSSSYTAASSKNITDDRGISPHDILSGLLSPKIYHILVVNTLSAVPVYAFAVFLPLVLAPLTKNPSPALVNLLTAPPYICGAITLYLFARWSDRHRKRIAPILMGLGVLLTGLTLVVLLPKSKGWAIPRYLSLNILLSGTFIASPLTVAWVSGNTPSPGKRALLLGINGWGNLAGVLSAMLFKPEYAKDGYIVSFWWTLVCVSMAAAGYILFWRRLVRENDRRKEMVRHWDEDERERERADGLGPYNERRPWLDWLAQRMGGITKLQWLARWAEEAREGGREGDERLTFTYGL